MPPQSPASSDLSDIPQQSVKKRRISLSSLSDEDGNDDDDDDEEEDRPLAARITAGSRSVPGKRSGKQAPGKKSKKSHTIQNGAEPSDHDPRPPTTNGWTNGINGYETRIKAEEKMDEGQLTRLTAGVPMDAVGRPSAAVRFSVIIIIAAHSRYIKAPNEDRETLSD